MYKVVVFQDNSVEVIPNSWMVKPGFCLWPSRIKLNHHKMVKACEPPPQGSRLHTVEVYKQTGKLNNINFTSTISRRL